MRHQVLIKISLLSPHLFSRRRHDASFYMVTFCAYYIVNRIMESKISYATNNELLLYFTLFTAVFPSLAER